MTLEEKRDATRIEHMHTHSKPCVKLQFPKITLALGGGMWHTISVLPLKGEITDYPRSGDVASRCVR